MQHNARLGGIFSIVCGAAGVVTLLGMVFFVLFFRLAISSSGGSDFAGAFTPVEMWNFLAFFYIAVGIFYALLGVLAIIGGVYALRQRSFALALAGAIAGVIIFLPCGIPAIIFTTMARPEFAAPATLT